MTNDNNEEKARLRKGHFDNYTKYNQVLRAWFVGFGFGGPALIFSSEFLLNTMLKGHWLLITLLFLFAGSVVQILVSFLNKVVAWTLYFGQDEEEFKSSLPHHLASKVGDMFWIDVLADCITLVSFGLALLTALGAVSCR